MSILATHVGFSALPPSASDSPPSESHVRSNSSFGLLIPVSSDINPIGSLLLRGPRPLSLPGCLPTDTGSTPVLLAPMVLLVAFAVLVPPRTPLPFSPPAYPVGDCFPYGSIFLH